jgi:cardiolipin synthase
LAHGLQFPSARFNSVISRFPVYAVVLCITLSGCTLSRPEYVSPDVAVGSPAFMRALEAHTQSGPVEGNRVDVLLNGDEIFPAMLAAVRQARKTVTFANFVYEPGDIAREMAEAMAERCRAGVKVNVLLDAVGSNRMEESDRAILRDAGCHLAFYGPLQPLSIRRFNHRNHRRVLVVDGRIGFTGGVGVGEPWTGDGRQSRHWRQTDVRVEGPVVRALQAAFAETWRETTGLLLGGDDYFPPLSRRGPLAIQAVSSSPASGATEAYMLFLLAIDSARSSIALTNPYFVPDDGIARALARAAERGVDVSIITAGVAGSNLDRLLRVASRAHFPRALKAGVKIYEYQPAYLHAKTVVIDRRWVSIGSVNIDNRSFALNSELNITALDRGLANRMMDIFARDLAHTRQAEPNDWKDATLARLFYMSLLPLRDQL